MRVPRSWLPSPAIYHVVSRSVFETAVFHDELDYVEWIGLYKDIRRRSKWKCHAYSLLTTHYHLVVETTVANLSEGMQRLNGVYAQRFNKRNARRGHLFEDRFSSWVVLDEQHLEKTIAYVLDNPRRAGLVGENERWPWAWSAANPEELAAA